MDGSNLVFELLFAVIIVTAIVVTMFMYHRQTTSRRFLSRAFFTFALLCGLFSFATQYGDVYQVGTQIQFGDPMFYVFMGILSMLGGIYVNTER